MGAAANRWIKLAQKLILKDGRATVTTITRGVAGTYDTTLLKDSDATPQTFHVRCAPTDEYKYHQFQQDGFTTIESFKTLYIAVNDEGYVPAIGDKVSLDVDWQITKILSVFETESVQCAYKVLLGL